MVLLKSNIWIKLETETVARDPCYCVVAAVGCLRCGGASHPGSLGIRCQNLNPLRLYK